MLKKFTSYFLILLIAGFYACNNEVTDVITDNHEPDTKVFLQPDTSVSQQQSKIQLWWSGDDPDGLVIGFYFSWDGTNWTFTENNDSLFSLQIGAVDTVFGFKVSAVDNSGNGVYDNAVVRNNINYGPEPFTDQNDDKLYNTGEPFVDIGLIDATPAVLDLPIKNSAPEIKWNVLSTHPDTTFTAMSFGWDAYDVDGNSSISKINIALNDTNNYVSVDGELRTITITTKDFISQNPLMDILIDGDPSSHPYDPVTGKVIKLPGLLYNAANIFYVQAVDISGAKSGWLSSADQSTPAKPWFVKKPKGQVIIIDDYLLSDNAPTFYNNMMDSCGLNGRYDVYDIKKNTLPYLNTTFLETIKLFDCTIWYGDASHSSDLASAVVQKYTGSSGKIMFSLLFPQTIDLTQIQGYIPIQADTAYYVSQLLGGLTLRDSSQSGYPELKTTKSLSRARGFNLNPLSVKPLYYFKKHEVPGYMGFINNDKNKFFIGVPLHVANGIPGSAKELFDKVLFQEFNLTR